MPIFELATYFLTPLAATWLAGRRGARWLDPVLICYAVGLLAANLPIEVDGDATRSVAEAVVPLAIPLLLFQTDFRGWLKSSRSTLVAFGVAVVSALVSLTVAAFLFRGGHDDLWMTTGMLAGTWTGGSPNLVSVGTALGAPEETFILTNAADVLVGGIYLLALLTVAQSALSFVMPEAEDVDPLVLDDDEPRPAARRIAEGAVSLGLGVIIVAACAGASLLVLDRLSEPWIMLGITTFGIAASFVPRVRAMEESFVIGNYLILVFCVAIGALTDLTALVSSGGFFLSFTASALAMTLALHYTVCALLRIDVDTAIIVSVSTVMGPALVVPVARRLNNRAAFVSGITSGLVGFAMANYVGVAMANAIRLI